MPLVKLLLGSSGLEACPFTDLGGPARSCAHCTGEGKRGQKKKKKKKDKKRKDKKRDKHAGHLHSRCCDLFWTKSMGVWVQVKKLVWFAWLKRQVPADRRVFA